MEKVGTPNTAASSANQVSPEQQQNDNSINSKGSASSPQHQQSHASKPSVPAVATSTASALVISACDKAGMEGIDRARIDAIILRESDKTLYMQQQRRRDEKVNERIQKMKERLDEQNNSNNTNNNNWQRQIEKELEPEIEEILSARRLRSAACVVDMDCFYWACELLSRPHLKDLPCCVGGSMITTSNYPARKFGVRSGMAGWIADKLVEELSNGQQKLIHVPNHFPLYQEKSKLAKAVFRQFDPKCRSYSLDEAYLDLTPYLALKLSTNTSTHEQISQQLSALFGVTEDENDTKKEAKLKNDENERTPLPDFDAILQQFSPRICLQAASDTVNLLRRKVCENTGGLTCSAGLANSFQLAKIASDIHKPDGQKIIGSDLEQDVWPFLRPLATRKVPGIGRVSQKMLEAFGVMNVQQLFDERALVHFLFGTATAKFLLRASLGGFGGSSMHDPEQQDESGEKSSSATISRKGISKERTFSHGEAWPKIYERLEDIARRLSKEMEEEGIFAKTISLKIKLHTFDVIQRSKTMANGIALQKGDDLFAQTIAMLQELKKEHSGSSFSPRLIGIRCSNLMDTKEVSTLAANQSAMAKFLSGPSAPPTTGTHANAKFRNRRERSKSPEPTAKRGSIESFFGNHTDDQSKAAVAVSTPNAAGTNEALKQPFKVMALKEHDSGACSDLASRESHEELTTSCPICNQAITAISEDDLNRALNDHIDSCLNAPVIRQAAREETQRCNSNRIQAPAKKQRLTEFFSK